MNIIGYLVIIAVLIPVAVLWSSKRSKSAVSVSDYWKQKELEYDEKRVLSAFARYLGGHPRFEHKTEGLLFLMNKSLWFENFEKGPNIFGFGSPFEKVLIRLPLSRVLGARCVPEADLMADGMISPTTNVRRINRKPEYLRILFQDDWGREESLYFDSMIDIGSWLTELAKAQKDYVPTPEESTVGACPKCGKKMSPDFKLCPFCGCNL
ncbi:MAG TPA: hypothetical protein VLH40_04990 [Atribacteraceae bacterium]|nr:hypothetical protein [Atribacteraceae bacterium]